MSSELYQNVDLTKCNKCKCYTCERHFGDFGFYVAYCKSGVNSPCYRCNQNKYSIVYVGDCPLTEADLNRLERIV